MIPRISKILTLGELADLTGLILSGDPETIITGAASVDEAVPGTIVFALDHCLLAQAEASSASAILASVEALPGQKPRLVSDNVKLAWVSVLEILYPVHLPPPGSHASSVIHPSAHIAPTASIAPYCVIGENVRIGDACVLCPGVIVGDNAHIGDQTILYNHVSVGPGCQIGRRNRIYAGAVIGSEGFGFAIGPEGMKRIPQIGIVRTDDDVEIGCNTTVDCSSLGETHLGKGVKIDNLVQIGHNVVIGDNTVIISQTGISGSCQIGSRVTIAGQVGIGDHIKIGDGATLAGQTGVVRDVESGSVLMGHPARPHLQYLREAALVARLPDLNRRVKWMEDVVSRLRGAASDEVRLESEKGEA